MNFRKNNVKTLFWHSQTTVWGLPELICRSFSPTGQDESSSSDDDDDDDEDWGSDIVDSSSESSDETEEKSSSLAVVFLKKWVSLSLSLT